jgi:hypothetical protein
MHRERPTLVQKLYRLSTDPELEGRKRDLHIWRAAGGLPVLTGDQDVSIG